MTTTPWITSRRSGANNANCLQARRHNGMIEIRDSKNPDGPVLTFTDAEFDAFLDGAGNGEFDHLLNH